MRRSIALLLERRGAQKTEVIMLTRLGVIAAAVAAISSLATAQATTPTPPPAPQAGAPAAQGEAAAGLREVKDGTRLVAPWNLTVDQIEDRAIHGASGEKIAEADSVLEDASGQISAVVAEFGGYFGIGDTEVIVGLDQLKPDGDHFATSLTQDQLSALPAWTD
jgi:hypothetical protein